MWHLVRMICLKVFIWFHCDQWGPYYSQVIATSSVHKTNRSMQCFKFALANICTLLWWLTFVQKILSEFVKATVNEIHSWDVHATMDLWLHKKRSGPEWWHTWDTRGGTSWGEARVTSLEMVWTYVTEAPIRNGVTRRTGNNYRGRGRSNLTWEESVKRDLKDWCITKELALDRREWKLAIHVPEPWSSVPSFYCFLSSFFLCPFFAFLT
jgi:hypothetical protein